MKVDKIFQEYEKLTKDTYLLESQLKETKEKINSLEKSLKQGFLDELKTQRENLTKAKKAVLNGDYKSAIDLINCLEQESQGKITNYILLPVMNTYAKGVENLRNAYKNQENSPHPLFIQENGSKIVRPLTFKETIEARVNDYESKQDKLRLFNIWNDSCTGIANKKNSKKFKIKPVCKELILINPDFNNPFLLIDYDSFNGIELNKKNGRYNDLLTKDEVLENPGWIESLEGDKTLLKTYRDIVFSELKQDKAMGFYVWDNLDSDQLRALLVSGIGGGSDAGGRNNLDGISSFLLAQA